MSDWRHVQAIQTMNYRYVAHDANVRSHRKVDFFVRIRSHLPHLWCHSIPLIRRATSIWCVCVCERGKSASIKSTIGWINEANIV